MNRGKPRVNVGDNNFGDEAADCIASVISHNTKLQSLNLCNIYLKSEGAINSLKYTSLLTVLNLSGNNIGDEAADDIAICLSCTSKLQNLDLSCNNFQKEGMEKIATVLHL